MMGIRFGKRQIAESVSLYIINRLIDFLFIILVILYSARVLQPQGLGKISFIVSIVSYFVVFAHLGMPIYGARLIAGQRNDAEALKKTANELWSIKVMLSLLSAVSFFLLTLFVPDLRGERILFLIYGSAIIFQVFDIEWLFKGMEQFRYLTICQMAIKTVALICMLMFVRSSGQLILYAFIAVLIGYGSCLISFFGARKLVHFSFKLSINKLHFRPLILFSILSCAASLYASLDLTMLGLMKSDIETGLYSVASKGKEFLTIFGGIVWMSVLPQATSLWKKREKKQFESLARKTLVLVSSINLIVMIVCMVFARWIVVLLGGNAYAGATTAFRILLLSLVPIGMSTILGGQVLISVGRERSLFQAIICGAIFNILANWFVIPRYSIEGVAVTTVFSEIVVTIWCFFAAKRKLGMDFGLPLVRTVLSIVGHRIILVRTKVINKYMGEKLPFYCSCCGIRLDKFIDGGYSDNSARFNPTRYVGMDTKVICPYCGSLPRHRILTLWMGTHIEELQGKRILHFAQEGCVRMWMDKNGISATTADLYEPADLQLDIEDTQLPNESYDVIICNHVLEHVSDFRKALRELHRIVALDGMVIISFPTDMNLETVYEDASITDEEGRIKHFGQNDHLRIFGRDSASMLESFGFEVEEITSDDARIKPVVGPADYDYNVLWGLRKR